MQFMHHGGHCCGIKIIEGLGTTPSAKVAKLEKSDLGYNNYREWAGTRYCRKARPEETALQRLDAYLKQDKNRYGITEIVLADAHGYAETVRRYKGTALGNSYAKMVEKTDQTRLWRTQLLKRGFVEVSRCFNSNSGNYIYVFHLIRSKAEEVKPEETVVVEFNEVFDEVGEV